MFDGEMVKTYFPLKQILDLENFWSKTKLDLENFLSKKFWKFLVQDKRKLLGQDLDLEHFWSKTKLDLENFHHISFLA